MTDEQLYQKARLYGRNALLWRQKFIGLLPEVQRRRLYERGGFNSVFEFAFKLAGLSEQQVRTALNLDRRFLDKPALRSLLENGRVSINKLVRVQSVATVENAEGLAEAVQVLSQKALETLVRDERAEYENDLNKPLNEAKSLRAQRLELNAEVEGRLLELQGRGIDLNELLSEFLDARETQISQEKEAICEELGEAKSRYIPVRTQKVVEAEFGKKCSISSCYRPAQELHHTQTFALSRRHDPHFLAPLCREHHQIAHAIHVKVQEKRREAVG